MASKEFKSTYGLSNWETSQKIITQAITSNSATTIDTTALNSFYSIEYSITIVQGSKVRTSKVSVQTDGTSVDSTEYGIVATGGAISGVAITATTSGSNMLLQVTITDAATTIARVRAIKNLLGVIQAYLPGAPTIGTATAGPEQATVAFTAPADNGLSAITSYLATSSPGSITGSAASSPITVTGLTGATAYTFTVRAINSIGTGIASAESNSVTPTIVPARAGFFSGGSNGSSTLNSVNKLLYSNDSISNLTATLSGIRNGHSGFSNSGTAGYFSGGFSVSNRITTVDKFEFILDSRSTLGTGLDQQTSQSAGLSNSSTAGYNVGGWVTQVIATANKFLFSNDSRSVISSAISPGRNNLAAASNSGSTGYVSGGANSGGNYVTTIDKFIFSTDTRSGTALNSAIAPGRHIGLSNSGTAGYFAGGDSSFGINKIQYSNETVSKISAGLTLYRQELASSENVGNAGYFAGGFQNSARSLIDKLTFSNETVASISATLSPQRYAFAGMSNQGSL